MKFLATPPTMKMFILTKTYMRLRVYVEVNLHHFNIISSLLRHLEVNYGFLTLLKYIYKRLGLYIKK